MTHSVSKHCQRSRLMSAVVACWREALMLCWSYTIVGTCSVLTTYLPDYRSYYIHELEKKVLALYVFEDYKDLVCSWPLVPSFAVCLFVFWVYMCVRLMLWEQLASGQKMVQDCFTSQSFVCGTFKTLVNVRTYQLSLLLMRAHSCK